jgi:effector-binding domain-containing protein
VSEISVVELSPQQVLGMRKTGAYREIPMMFLKIFEFIFSKNIQIAGYPTFLCHEISCEEVEKANKEENADIEVVVPVAGTTEHPDNEEIHLYELPGGKMAKIIHKGPYEECAPTYEKLFSWIVEQGKTIVGPVREVYFNDPREVPPEEILTEIYAPID